MAALLSWYCAAWPVPPHELMLRHHAATGDPLPATLPLVRATHLALTHLHTGSGVALCTTGALAAWALTLLVLHLARCAWGGGALHGVPVFAP